MISFKSDGSIILDGYKVQISVVNKLDANSDISTRGTVWKSVKSLSPYGNLKPSDYNKFLASGKQNVSLGRTLDAITVTALSSVITRLHPYAGFIGSLATVAQSVYSTFIAINPKTQHLGCAYTTYTFGTSDYKYINKFYANKECVGKYCKKLAMSILQFIKEGYY